MEHVISNVPFTSKSAPVQRLGDGGW